MDADAERCRGLLARVARGDAEALGELFEADGRFIFCVAYGVVRDWQLAEDVTQDVFLRIRLHAGRFRGGENPLGWLYVITRNTARNALKAKKRGAGARDPADAPAPGGFEDRIALRSALGSLPPAERQIVLLYLAESLSQKEIARLLRLPAPAVNWRYRSALKKLRRMLGEGGSV